MIDAIEYLRVMSAIERKFQGRQNYEFNPRTGKVAHQGIEYSLSELYPGATVSLQDLMKCTEKVLAYVNPKSDEISISFTPIGLIIKSQDTMQKVTIDELGRVIGVAPNVICKAPEKVPMYDTKGRYYGTINNVPKLVYEMILAGFVECAIIECSYCKMSLHVHKTLNAVIILCTRGVTAHGMIVIGRTKLEDYASPSFKWHEGDVTGKDGACYHHSLYNGFSLDLATVLSFYKGKESWSEPLGVGTLTLLMQSNLHSLATQLYSKETVFNRSNEPAIINFLLTFEKELLIQKGITLNQHANKVLSPAFKLLQENLTSTKLTKGFSPLWVPSAVNAISKAKKTIIKEYGG